MNSSLSFDVLSMAPNVESLNDNVQAVIKEYVRDRSKDSFIIPPISEKYIQNTLNALDISKATRLDGLSARFLKISSQIISKPLMKFIN